MKVCGGLFHNWFGFFFWLHSGIFLWLWWDTLTLSSWFVCSCSQIQLRISSGKCNLSLFFFLNAIFHRIFPIIKHEPFSTWGNTEDRVSGFCHASHRVKTLQIVNEICPYCWYVGRFKWCFRLCAHSFHPRYTSLWLESNYIWPSYYIIIKQLNYAHGVL